MNTLPTDSDIVVSIEGLTRRFGSTVALDTVDLSVPRGAVFGVLGANGAGKTTLIKHVLGLLAAQSGTVRVLGRDPVADPVSVLSRLGYLSEENDLPGWMRVDELLSYTRAFFPTWDDRYAEQLREEFALDPSAKVKNLSKGQKARAGLLAALAYRPELLILDEPSSGLDPIVRRDILGAIIRTIADEGRTVLFSSHLLDEVERVADHVALMNKGKIVYHSRLDDLKTNHRCFTLRFHEPQYQAPELDGVLTWEGGGHEWTALFRGQIGVFQAATVNIGATIVEERTPTLDEIFVAQVGKSSSRTTKETAAVS